MAKVPRHQLAAIIADKLGDSAVSAEQLSREVAAYLLETGRSGELDSLLRDIMQLRADKGMVEVLAHSAFPLSESVRKDIEAEVRAIFPDATAIIVSEVPDRSVVAGVKLELANQQLDLSVRAKLNRFKQLTTA
jgi:F0F1-type ATP synthase delta subunit